MVKYQKLNIAVNGQSNKNSFYREFGSLAESPSAADFVKVRPGANLVLSYK